MERILITGGTGFVGRCLITRLLALRSDIEIRTLSRNEETIARLISACNDSRFSPIVGDVTDVTTVRFALRGVDTVVHLAAMKHVDICEKYPQQAISTNVDGTLNLLKYFTGKTFVALSTGKAVEPCNCYGATKMLLERLLIDEAIRRPQNRYIVIRTCNVTNSSGSVLEKWQQQITETNEITITNPEMTRWFIDPDCLCDFVTAVMERGESGKIYVAPGKMNKIGDMAKEAVRQWGNKDTVIKVIGPRPGERVHENAFKEDEANVVVDFPFVRHAKANVA
ncbi:MAG: polysaccharide biosynthesis protein [Chloroflexota bacterium]|nr:polysaccharide biosynthesis protein [Chloroflexota bacterium]